MLRRVLAAVTLALAASAAAFGQANADAARAELNEGVRLYREGQFAEAEARFRRALELDPEAKSTRVFIARAAQQQYKPGLQTPENLAAGERAVAEYQEILAKDPANEDAYKAVVFLYGQMKRDDKVAEMLTQRANDFSAPNRQRAEAFTILASKQWQCSYDVTERKENKTTEQQKENKTAEQQKENKPAEQKPEQMPVRPVIKYKMPADQGDFIRARQCATDGMQFAEQAVTLDPDNPNAWANKANLLREAAKLAEMEGDTAGKAEYDRQYLEAFATQKRVSAEARQKAAAAERERAAAPQAAPTPRPAAPGKGAVRTGAVLNSRATFKPLPPYPPEAKAAGVEGTVVVWVSVDEAGKVVEAEAISGPPPLREAAVAAARRALIKPTLLSGQPAKTKGVLTYQFVLKPEAARPPR